MIVVYTLWHVAKASMARDLRFNLDWQIQLITRCD